MEDVPEDYIKPSAAKVRLAERMFGGLPRRQDIADLKQQYPRLRVRPGAWQEVAARRLREAAVAEDISVYLWSGPSRDISTGSSFPKLSPGLVRRLIPVREGIPDHPYRVQRSLLQNGLVTSELFSALQTGILVFRTDEFETWCEVERGRGLWPSQQATKRPRPGRPSKKSNALRARITALVKQGIWTADQSVMALHRLLEQQESLAVPSHDSIARLVDALHLETGDPNLRRTIRRRSG